MIPILPVLRFTGMNIRTTANLIPVMLLSVLGALPAAAQLSGAVQTTLPDGTTVNGNIYPSKAQVFLTAGPQNQKASGLPDGRYYYQVTDPSGSTLLSNDPAACRQLVVSGGRLSGAYGTPLDTAGCEHASSAANPATGIVPVQAGGAFRACSTGGTSPDIFCDTPNPGGEYKLWLIAQSSAVAGCNPTVNPDRFSLTFDKKCSKTDNFKLALPAVAHVVACKFNDANGNGVLDPGELMISGWPITATVAAGSFVTLRSDNQAGASVTANTDSTGCVSFAASGIPNSTQAAVGLTEAGEVRWTQTAPGNGSYDASGKPASGGVTSVATAVPSTGLPASGGVISVNLAPGATVTAPHFGNTNAQCPDCSILGTVTVVNTATASKLYTWGITKAVDKAEIDNVPPAGSATFNYTVSVTHDSGAGRLLTGTITLINGDGGNPFLTLNVNDAVSDGGICRIKDPSSGMYVDEVFNLTLASFTEMSLPYQCTYSSGATPAAGINTVTAANLSNSSVQYTGATHYDFTTASSVADGNVTITDTLKGSLGTVSSTDASPRTFSYPITFTGDPAGTCTSHNNTATFTSNTTAAAGSASQSVKSCVNNPVSLTSTPNLTSVTLGSSPVTLKDSATLSGAVNPTGTLTFTLIYGGQTIDTETVTVNGNGTYTTPTGYALPATGTVVGAYQWNASYSGDARNAAISENGNTAEQVAIVKAAVSLTGPTFGGQSVETLPQISINLSGGYNPAGTLTLRVVNSWDNSIVCSLPTAVNGNGTYNPPTTCSLPSLNSVYVYADYSGDTNNSSRSISLGSLFPVL